MKSALFVDFDNVFTQLHELSPEAAERFARQPGEWMRWLTDTLGVPDGHPEPAARRRVLVRRCYLNPNWYQRYRHAFLRAGFEIVDCPPVTSQGKTSTDIHMVLDIVELLAHETRYDEFIVLSADADFTPVLRKLRRYDRRTTVLAIGFPSAAYQASADLMVDERLFIEQALGLAADAPAAATLAMPPTAPPVPPAEPAPSAPPVASADELAAISARIAALVAQSPLPLPASTLASRLRHEFAPLLDQWQGHAGFKPFFLALGLAQLQWLPVSGGRIADPAVHQTAPDPEAAAGEVPAPWAAHEALLPLAREVSGLTGAPLLAPPVVQGILALLCEDLARQGYEPTETARRIVEACPARCGVAVSMRDVVFMLRGLQLNGHVFGRGLDDLATLSRRLVNQVLFLCQREQMVLGEEQVAAVRRWIGGA